MEKGVTEKHQLWAQHSAPGLLTGLVELPESYWSGQGKNKGEDLLEIMSIRDRKSCYGLTCPLEGTVHMVLSCLFLFFSF